jgi:hypothetical protein
MTAMLYINERSKSIRSKEEKYLMISSLLPLKTMAYVFSEYELDTADSMAAAVPVLAPKYPMGKPLTSEICHIVQSVIMNSLLDNR